MIVPERTEFTGFVLLVTTTVPLLLPLVVLRESQSSDSERNQEVLEVIFRFCELPSAAKAMEAGATDINKLAPCWVTVTVWVRAPIPVKVIMPVRTEVSGFAVQETFSVPLLVPPDALRESQLSDSVAVQVVLEVMERGNIPPAVGNDRDAGETPRAVEADCWVMETLRLVTPGAEKVRTALRTEAVPLGAAVTVTVPLLLPDTVESVIQSGFPVIVQVVLDVTATDWAPPAEVKLIVVGLTLRLFSPFTCTKTALGKFSFAAKKYSPVQSFRK